MRKAGNSIYCTDDGSILVLVLWVIALLTMVAGYFSVEARLRGNMGHNAWNLLKSRLEIESILNLTSIYLGPLEQKDDTEDPDHFIFADGSQYKVRINGRDVKFRLEDERGKLDINTVSEDTLGSVLDALLEDQNPGLASRLTDCILDWKDNDEDRRSGGAEKDYYEKQIPPYKPANSRFLLLEQLLLVRYMTPRIFWGPIEWNKSAKKDQPLSWKGGIQDIFTVYNQAGVVIKAAAPEPLLDILDEQELSDKGGRGTLRFRTCLYQGCYQVFWDAKKNGKQLYTLLHWQHIPRFD